MIDKRCILHIPYKVNLKIQSGTNIRPVKILNALKEDGYEVEVISGYSNERKMSIKRVMEHIKSGIKYEFVYSESSTMPTLLTDKNHIPIHPFMDFNFLKYCSKNNIKIGLFYRDIHWKFSQYKNTVSFLKRFVAKFFYEYDLKKYNSLIDILYLPSQKMYKYLDIDFKGKIEELPPGAEIVNIDNLSNKEDSNINIFYVGGLSEDLYNLELIFSSVNKNPHLNLVVCCRKKEWEINKEKYNKYINDRIKIIHESGEKICKYVESSDIMCLYLRPTEYWEFAMPVKLFTYIGFKKPILSVEKTLAGEFVKQNNIGWCLEYDNNKLDDFFKYIIQNEHEIYEKQCNIDRILDNNTWKARASKIIDDLTSL